MRLNSIALVGSLVAPSQMPINASAGRAWDAVVDVFASREIPIRMMERASGFIATDQLGVTGKQARQWTEICGRHGLFPIVADRAGYNVLVRGDSAASTVKVTVRWTHGGAPFEPRLRECRSRNVRESELEAAIKVSAEAH